MRVMSVTFQRFATGLRWACEGPARGCGHGIRNPRPHLPDRPHRVPGRRSPGAWGSGPGRGPRPLTIAGATADEEQAVDWAFHRYGEAGLQNLPPLEVHMHRSRSECRGGLGLYLRRPDRSVHQGLERGLPAQVRAPRDGSRVDGGQRPPGEILRAFMQRRRVTDWNDRRFPGRSGAPSRRPRSSPGGSERARSRHCYPTPVDAETLASLYVLLTSRTPITPAAAG